MSAPLNRQDNSDLWRHYRGAFEIFAQHSRTLQFLQEQANVDQRAVDAALLELEIARVAYNISRDALAADLLALPAAFRAPLRGEADAAHVRTIAELRWELTGRPNGTADDDWRRAEEIVRCAAAAA